MEDFQLILFDFDGLLVNTEELHFQAYKNVCANRGFELPWSFSEFCQIAHYRSDGVRQEVYRLLPELKKQAPHWDVLYQEKKEAFLKLISEGKVELMPGAQQLLKKLQELGIRRCVVTHSAKSLVDSIRRHQPILDTIPFWITREDYSHPKPDPECYFKAIEKFANKEDSVLGLEDSPRGLTALMKTRAKAILVCNYDYPEIPTFITQGASRVRSLNDLLKLFSSSVI